MKNANTLLATSPTIEGIEKAVQRYFFNDNIRVTFDENSQQCHIVKPGKQIESFVVVKKGKRFRFEEKNT